MPDTILSDNLRPDTGKFKITKSSARRLAALSGLTADKLAGKSIDQLSKAFPHQIDPHLFLFRQVCGRVVKTDPVTGIDYGVPFATVQVEDTDCSLLGFFPAHAPWGWYFPFNCRREVIATTRTDACGNFCVWVPRFDIDWVVRFRLEHRCYPIIFERPNLKDLIEQVEPPIPVPGPDPRILASLVRGRTAAALSERFGPAIAARADVLTRHVGPGANVAAADAALAAPAPLDHVRPPLPVELTETILDAKGRPPAVHPAIATLAARLAVNAKDLADLDLRRCIGPFKRCHDVIFPEWVPVLDIPDITFKVLQDANGDGVEEPVYSEGYFQVRWNASNIGPVTLHAGPNARASANCGAPVPCGNAPAIMLAGRLPVTNNPGVYDAAHGYSVVTNRPHPAGTMAPPAVKVVAQTPLTGTLALIGCNKTQPGATHYRFLYDYSANGIAPFTTPSPLTGGGIVRDIVGLGGGTLYSSTAAPDAQGWIPIDPGATAFPVPPLGTVITWALDQLLIDWPTRNFQNGVYRLTLQVGKPATGPMGADAPTIAFAIDNSGTMGAFTVEWATTPAGPFTALGGDCPVIRRGTVAQDVYVRFTLPASAAHLLYATMTPYGCGPSGTFGPMQLGGVVEHWHTGPTDNAVTLQATYQLPHTSVEGTYGVSGEVAGRATRTDENALPVLPTPPNPANWDFDAVFVHHYPGFAFSVINADP